MKNVNVTLRVDEELKQQADTLFSDLGLSLTTAFNIFLRQAVREQQIPFIVGRRIPNADTIDAINEVQQMKANQSCGKTYEDSVSMFKDVLV